MVLKRFAWDYTYYHNKKVTEALSDDKKNKNIAIIGAGPAGLSASYYLALKGYNVKIYDMLPEPGGMVAVGIPDYRQPRELLRAEVEDILSLGVGIVYNTKIGRDIPFKDIISAFDAVLIAVGAFKSHEMGVVGENEDYEGLMTSGIDFLQSIALGEKIEVGKKVIIVGGGNTAIDCARSSIRLGFDEVIIAYRRSRKEMPAEDFEVEAALEEGVKFHFLVAPQRVIAEGNKVVGLECLKMQLSEPDESGRRRPTPIAGSEFILECDTIIPAIGQYSSLDFLTLSDGIEVTKWNTIKVIDDLYMTKKEGVFAAGDCQFGPDTVVRATSEGRTAAIMMDRYLTKGYPFLEDEEKLELTIHKNKLAFNEEEKVIEPKSIDRIKQTILPVDLRRTTFEEVEKPYTEKQAYLEATRCLRCIRFAMITLNKGNVDG
jgi:formate dehydrogenase beta subunit